MPRYKGGQLELTEKGSLPGVSIIIPVFNGANFLGEAIASALAQTYPHIEIIVINDGSNDGGKTESLARSFGEAIRYFYIPNGGIARALNFGIAAMQGELFSWLSHDDIYTPQKIEKAVAAFMASDGQSIVYSNFFVMDKHGVKLYSHKLPRISDYRMRCFLMESNALHGCTLLIPRNYLQIEGGFDESLKTTQDYDFWFRLASKYPFCHVDEELVGVRFHSGQTTTAQRKLVKEEQDQLYFHLLSSINSVEVSIYTNGCEQGFYLNLYRRFRASGFENSAELVKQKIFSSTSDNLLLMRFTWVAVAGVSLTRVRIFMRQLLFGNDTSLYSKVILKIVRLIF